MKCKSLGTCELGGCTVIQATDCSGLESAERDGGAKKWSDLHVF